MKLILRTEKNVHFAYVLSMTDHQCKCTITDACWQVSNHYSFVFRSSRVKEIWHGLILGYSGALFDNLVRLSYAIYPTPNLQQNKWYLKNKVVFVKNIFWAVKGHFLHLLIKYLVKLVESLVQNQQKWRKTQNWESLEPLTEVC